jgi:hypothetical protein
MISALLLVSVAQIVTFLAVLHHYSNGVGTKARSYVAWTPPGGETMVIGLVIVGQMLLFVFLIRHYRPTTHFDINDHRR